MKRFYKDTGIDEGEGGFRVLLDGKPMRTPAKAVLVVPTRALAEAIAAEWAAVPEKAEINAAHLPLTRLAATGIDRVVSRRDEVIADTSKYAGSDLLCYRAAGPDSLVGLQRERWDPLLAWTAERHGAHLVTAQGIGFVEQAAGRIPTRRGAARRASISASSPESFAIASAPASPGARCAATRDTAASDNRPLPTVNCPRGTPRHRAPPCSRSRPR